MAKNDSKENKYSQYEEQYLNNSEGLFSTFLTWYGRISRLEYVIDFIVFFVLTVIIRIAESNAAEDYNYSLWWFLWFLEAVVWLLFIIQCIKRSHDVNNSGWMILIPFYPIILLFLKGNLGINKYGSDPRLLYGVQIDAMLKKESENVDEDFNSSEEDESDVNDSNNDNDVISSLKQDDGLYEELEEDDINTAVINENSNIIQQKNDALQDNPGLSSLENGERDYHKEEEKDESENDKAAPIVEKNGNNLLSENKEPKLHNKKTFIRSRFFKYACICIAIILIAIGLFYAVPLYQHYKYEKALSLIEKGDLVKGGDKLKSIVESSLTDSQTHTLALMSLVDLYHQKNNMDSAVFYARLIPDDIDKKELYMGYAYCSGISPNYTMAYYWWKKGANKGDGDCWDNMGLLYHEGWGTKADIRKALKYFKKALDVNPEDPFALRHIGEIYLEYMNVEKAQKYYQMAADLGDEEAQEALSRIELEGTNYE